MSCCWRTPLSPSVGHPSREGASWYLSHCRTSPSCAPTPPQMYKLGLRPPPLSLAEPGGPGTDSNRRGPLSDSGSFQPCLDKVDTSLQVRNGKGPPSLGQLPLAQGPNRCTRGKSLKQSVRAVRCPPPPWHLMLGDRQRLPPPQYKDTHVPLDQTKEGPVPCMTQWPTSCCQEATQAGEEAAPTNRFPPPPRTQYCLALWKLPFSLSRLLRPRITHSAAQQRLLESHASSRARQQVSPPPPGAAGQSRCQGYQPCYEMVQFPFEATCASGHEFHT